MFLLNTDEEVEVDVLDAEKDDDDASSIAF
jgi:hypothetical protein